MFKAFDLLIIFLSLFLPFILLVVVLVSDHLMNKDEKADNYQQRQYIQPKPLSERYPPAKSWEDKWKEGIGQFTKNKDN